MSYPTIAIPAGVEPALPGPKHGFISLTCYPAVTLVGFAPNIDTLKGYYPCFLDDRAVNLTNDEYET